MNTPAKRYRTLWLLVLVTTAIATTIDLLVLSPSTSEPLSLPLSLSLIAMAWGTSIAVAQENCRYFRMGIRLVISTILLAGVIVLPAWHAAVTPLSSAPDTSVSIRPATDAPVNIAPPMPAH